MRDKADSRDIYTLPVLRAQRHVRRPRSTSPDPENLRLPPPHQQPHGRSKDPPVLPPQPTAPAQTPWRAKQSTADNVEVRGRLLCGCSSQESAPASVAYEVLVVGGWRPASVRSIGLASCSFWRPEAALVRFIRRAC